MGWTWNRFLARRFLYLINNTFGSCNLSSLGGAIFKTAHNFVSAVNVKRLGTYRLSIKLAIFADRGGRRPPWRLYRTQQPSLIVALTCVFPGGGYGSPVYSYRTLIEKLARYVLDKRKKFLSAFLIPTNNVIAKVTLKLTLWNTVNVESYRWVGWDPFYRTATAGVNKIIEVKQGSNG